MNNYIDRIYKDAQKACGLKEGDWVKVIESAPKWPSWYCESMDKTVGAVGMIIKVNPCNFEVRFEDCQFYYPYFVLKKVDKPVYEFKPFEPVLVRDREYDRWEPYFYSRYQEGKNFPYVMIGNTRWSQCIPYVGNEDLCDTVYSPKE